MPVKRRRAKRRDPEAEYQTWSAIFDAGCDFFGELSKLGLTVEWGAKVPADLAREPWQRFGRRWMAERGAEKRLRPIWAIEEFGEP